MHVTLTMEKDFYLNRVVLEALGEPKAVRYFFDVGRSRIGLRAESPEVEQAVLVRPRGNQALARAGHFCTYYGIRPEGSITFQDVYVDNDGMLVLDLKTARRVRR